jgi:hypothetical protein
MEKQDKQIPVTAAIYARLTSDQSVEQQIEQCRQQALGSPPAQPS